MQTDEVMFGLEPRMQWQRTATLRALTRDPPPVAAEQVEAYEGRPGDRTAARSARRSHGDPPGRATRGDSTTVLGRTISLGQDHRSGTMQAPLP